MVVWALLLLLFLIWLAVVMVPREPTAKCPNAFPLPSAIAVVEPEPGEASPNLTYGATLPLATLTDICPCPT